MIRAEGAPVDLGRAQGRARHREIGSAVSGLRARYGPLAWLLARRRARRGPGRTLGRQLPQQSERLDGIAAGAGVPAAALGVAESLYRVQGTAWYGGARVQACFELPWELAPLLALRTSRPDAGGFPSAELVLAPFGGCLAGVNSEGLAVVCARDLEPGGVSLRFLAQELVLRSGDLGAAIEHLRRRARYAGGSGELLLADANGAAARAVLVSGELGLRPPAGPDLALEPEVLLDTASRRIVWMGKGPCDARPPAPAPLSTTSAR